MIRRQIQFQIQEEKGVSPIAHFVQIANRYKCSIYLEHGNVRVNAKSIMGMMSLGVYYGEPITLEADGEDETEALACMEEFLSGASG